MPAGSRWADRVQPRVMQVITQLGLGGAEAIALDIIEGLPSAQAAGVFVVMARVNDEIGTSWQRQLSDRGVPLVLGSRLPIKVGGLAHAGFRLSRAIAALRPDIVHLHTEIPEATYAVAARAFGKEVLGAVVVRTVHNSTLWPRWRAIARWSEATLTDKPVAAVSGAALAGLQHLRASFSMRPIGPKAARIIYNGRPIPSGPPAVRPSDGRLRLLFAGRFEAQKGADLLPDIFRALDPVLAAGIDLTVAGSGTLAGMLRRALETIPELPPPTITQPIPDLANRLTEYDVVIMPSRFEGFGLLAVEAALAGVTLVATRAPGLDEVLPPGHPWCAAPDSATSFAAAIATAISHREAWPRVNETARRFTEQRFALETMRDAYRQWYAEIGAGLGTRSALVGRLPSERGPQGFSGHPADPAT